VTEEIGKYVQQFSDQIESYKSPRYNETQLRREFLDPLFKCLGWDIDNSAGYAEAYKEVIHEDAIRVGSATKAPDYCFRVGGVRKFFVEAKKPSVDIRNHQASAYQLRRYGWSAKLPISVLSDFEEFAIYDTRIRPLKTDGPAVARIGYFRYVDYEQKWEEISGVFSKEAILKGSFDQYVKSSKKKRGTTEVDDAFLIEIENWRVDLSRNFALRNPKLSEIELNYAVQVTIDRIVFLRICEDRGIEPYGVLRDSLDKKEPYSALLEIFHRADAKYNSGLFHLSKEAGRIGEHDSLTPILQLDAVVLKRIIASLYYPDSPYEFSVLSPVILGQVYERFLGKVIRLTKGHRANIVEKPEVKKAGGVYYTPQFVVQHIIEKTVGEALKGKSVARKFDLTILDPACGSGSFLLGVLEYLFNWYKAGYIEVDSEKYAKGKEPKIFRSVTGEWRLSIAERKRILLRHVYGVDVDPQAVEVTKLSLLLKVLEGEDSDSLATQLSLFHAERALPDLRDNIKCGNSLVDTDVLEGTIFTEDDTNRINPFDWASSFEKVISGGGFDVLLGNPPYVNAWTLFSSDPILRDYLGSKSGFKTAERHWDLYVLFLEQSLRIAKKGALISFIIPYSYCIQKYGQASRAVMLKETSVASITDFRHVKVFDGVPVITVVPVFLNTKPKNSAMVSVIRPGLEWRPSKPEELRVVHKIPQKRLRSAKESSIRIDLDDRAIALCKKVEEKSLTVRDIGVVRYGAQMSSKKSGDFGKADVLVDEPTNAVCHRSVSGRNLYNYSIEWAGKYVDWSFAPRMYGPRPALMFEQEKLMIRDLTGTHRLEICLDSEGFYFDHTILCVQLGCRAQTWIDVDESIVSRSQPYDYLLLQALLGSKLVSAYSYLLLSGEGVRVGGGFHTYPDTIRRLPVFDLEAASNAEQTLVRKLRSNAESLLLLKQKSAKSGVPQEKTQLQRRVSVLKKQIDTSVAELYGLDNSDLEVVENALNPTVTLSLE